MAKVAVIGAGNIELTRKIISDLFGAAELAGSLHIALHDIDPMRLATAEAIVRRIDSETCAAATIDAHADRRAALADADYVICQIEVGGLDAAVRDFEIPRRYGIRQTIGDTLGIGGIFRGLRTAPVLIGIARDMAELCPQAWLLSYCDPMAILCWSTYAAVPDLRVVGICHSVRDTHSMLADLVGRELAEITFHTAGVNHQAFVLTFEADGRSLYPDLDEAIAADPELRGHVRVELYRRFGFFPTESSEHAAEYLPWFLRHDREVARLGLPVDEYFRRRGKHLDDYERVRRMLAAGEPVTARWKHFEMASEIIHSLITDRSRTVYVSVPNRGLITNLPAEACVEVPATVDADGIHPQRIGDLPVQLAALNRTFLNVAELTVAAALNPRRSTIHQAAMLDPSTAATLTLPEIAAMCDELIGAHAALLPSLTDVTDDRIVA
ncbi:alpha-galactosidase [Dactylosporangium sp. NPDC048998]|uniref:alpha-galactosidase n=1 Tax=Dactylosporangium sp. NPDC048998 TaxID=3363976 RepID=UPI003721540D